MRISTIWKALPVFRYSSPAISLIKSLHEMHISLFLTCKCEIHCTNTYAQLAVTAPVKCNNQTDI